MLPPAPPVRLACAHSLRLPLLPPLLQPGHLGNNDVLDDDVIFLHMQEQVRTPGLHPTQAVLHTARLLAVA